MTPPLPPRVDADTLLARRTSRPLWSDPDVLTTQPYGEPLTFTQLADRIVEDVERDGDEALRRIAGALDAPLPASIEVERDQLEAMAARCPAEVRDALRLAAGRIRAFSRDEPVGSWQIERDGTTLGQLARPVGRVGVYAPGGTAPLASSLLMAAVPARVAGVGEVILCTPAVDGGVPPVLAAAAIVAEVDRVFAVGGPSAVAAMGVGTGTVPRVDLICGPGAGPTVATMARLAGRVGVVSLPGPTETLLVADDSADAAIVASDLLAQAEHDPAAWPVLVTTSAELAERVQLEVAAQLPSLERAEVARASLGSRGAVVLVDTLDEAVEVANRFAAEHLCLLTADPWSLVDGVTDAGGILVGEPSCEALGDYVAGPSHIMPTGGSARWSSPISVRDFVRMTSVIGIDADTAARLAPPAITLAEAEGLTAHAASLRRRLAPW